jgi:hypothetical protein
MAETPDKESKSVAVQLRPPRTSRYLPSRFYPDLEGAYGRWPFNLNTFKPHDSDEFYTVVPGDQMRWDLLSYRLYGSTFLWWILPLVNGSRDPLDGRPFVGEVIRVPQVSRILGVLQVT